MPIAWRLALNVLFIETQPKSSLIRRPACHPSGAKDVATSRWTLAAMVIDLLFAIAKMPNNAN